MLYTLKNPTPSQPRHAMLVAADAKAIGAVMATRVGGANKRPRTRILATDCKVTRADGSTYVIAARTTARKAAAPKPKVRVIADTAMSYSERLERFGAIGNVE